MAANDLLGVSIAINLVETVSKAQVASDIPINDYLESMSYMTFPVAERAFIASCEDSDEGLKIDALCRPLRINPGIDYRSGSGVPFYPMVVACTPGASISLVSISISRNMICACARHEYARSQCTGGYVKLNEEKH